MPRRTETGPALTVDEAAKYLGWNRDVFVREWRDHPLIKAAAVKDKRRLTFLQPRLDEYLTAHRVVGAAS